MLFSSVAPALTDLNEFAFMSIDGGTLDIREFGGKAVLLTNTASRCGFTKQYSDLEQLHQILSNQKKISLFPLIRKYKYGSEKSAVCVFLLSPFVLFLLSFPLVFYNIQMTYR